MEQFKRYAVYYAPRAGAFAEATASWLGRDVARGVAVAHPDLAGLPDAVARLTEAPRKYGFHGTIRAPFRLADGVTRQELSGAVDDLARRLPRVAFPRLALRVMKGFVALVPEGDDRGLIELGARVVTALDPLRAALTAQEIARRDPARLSERQRELLGLWGYPYVMEEFRFHLTLTGDLPGAQAEAVVGVLWPWIAPVLPEPFVIEDLCLFGEDGTGRFHLVSRHALAG
ncbi:DUF1045 domain-containing protein [Paragemmobacter straminiformis]|uniref:DUF1045 domain-containing protein n=1 Tax=Paragemmobacter straminiformis TaxID=2045119 RepID=A0A842IBA3_9RHOB|nr:DUF1045 domain-containing protein [Gemmobacter straminiformis]MBC2836859.1 DUF1045 domain-containing protein [Gemmobacter straminiformis]